MTVALARRLIWEGVVAPEDVSVALQVHVTERLAFIRALLRHDPRLVDRLEAELGHVRGASASIVPDATLMRRLPHGLAAVLLAVPVGRDPASGVVRVVAADPSDTHIAVEMSHHFAAPVEVVSGPLRAVVEALGLGSAASPPRERSNTSPFGSSIAPASSKPPRAQIVASPLHRADAATAAMRPSDRPIPLVRVSADAPTPKTVKGVAPQASGTAFASSVVVPPSPAPRIATEPVIQLTRTKSLAPSPPPPGPLEETVHGPEAAAPGSAPVAPEPDVAILDLQEAATPEEVVSILAHGFGRAARRVIVLAVRGKVFEGRDTNDDAIRDAVRGLVIAGDRPSVTLTATQAGQYVGPMPQTPAHQDLSRILGNPSDDIAVGSVTVGGRAALVYVASGLDTVYLATRRGQDLAEAASRALERIVRKRKK